MRLAGVVAFVLFSAWHLEAAGHHGGVEHRDRLPAAAGAGSGRGKPRRLHRSGCRADSRQLASHCRTARSPPSRFDLRSSRPVERPPDRCRPRRHQAPHHARHLHPRRHRQRGRDHPDLRQSVGSSARPSAPARDHQPGQSLHQSESDPFGDAHHARATGSAGTLMNPASFSIE